MRRGHQPGAPTFLNVIVPPRVTMLGVNGYAPSASVGGGRLLVPPPGLRSPWPAALPGPAPAVLAPPIGVESTPPLPGGFPPAAEEPPPISELLQATALSMPSTQATKR